METHYRLRSYGRTVAILAFSWLIASPCFPGQASKDDPVVIMAISHRSIMDAMEDSPEDITNGRVEIGIAAFLSPDGSLHDPLCNSDDQSKCKLIVKTFLSHPRTYKGISGEPTLSVTSIPTKLGDCYETTALGRTSGSTVTTALVSSNPALFNPVQPKLLVSKLEQAETQSRVAQIIRKKSADLPIPLITRIEKFRLMSNGDTYLVAEGRKDDTKDYSMFLGVWRVSGDVYTLVASNEETGFQEPENFIGTIHIKGEKSDFVVTSYSHSEGYEFHIYGLRDGVFQRIYAGGGADC